MSDKPSGYGTMQIGGQERPFHVGINQGEIFAELPHRRGEDGRPLSLRAYGELFSLDRLKENDLTGADLRDFVYSALASGYAVDGARLDFNHVQVGHWLDDADADEAAKPLKEMVAQFVKRAERAVARAKNDPAPKPKKATGLKATTKGLAGPQ